MLKLRHAIVVEAAPGPEVEQLLLVQLLDAAGAAAPGTGDGSPDVAAAAGRTLRPAICDTALLGRAQARDRVIVNTAAVDVRLGSGGFDIVHANLTRLGGDGEGGGEEPASAPAGEVRVRRGPSGPGRDEPAHVFKLNYTSLQHAVRTVEAGELRVPLGKPVAVLALHGQLAAVAWAFAGAASGRRLGYVQTAGGALPGNHSRTVAALRERGLLAGHVTAGASFGGESEAITTAGALHHGLAELGWDAAVCGPGPGIVGSGSALGHGGMEALDSAHVALALDCPTLLVARLSGADRRERHRPISHHTLTVLDLLLAPVTVALPAGVRSPVGAELRAGLADVFAADAPERPAFGPVVRRPARIARHDWRRATVDLAGFAASGVAGRTMGRGPLEDPLFFGAALAGGGALAELCAVAGGAGPAPSASDLERV